MRSHLIFWALLCVVACSTPEYLSESELYEFIQEEGNGLSKQRKAGSVDMQVFYHPNDFLVWQEVELESDSARIREAFSRYEPYAYFMMQLSVGEKDALYGLSANQIDFNDRLQTLSFRMNQFVNLTTSNSDTIPVADFYYSRMFGLSKSNDVLFVFNRERMEDAEWVSLNTKEFGFRTGRQSFRFQVDDLNNVPRLLELDQKVLGLE